MLHLKIIRKAFDTRKIIQNPEKTGPNLVSCGILFFNLRGLSWPYHTSVVFCRTWLVLKTIKNPTFCIEDSKLTSSHEKDLLSHSHEQRRKFIQLASTLNLLFHPFFPSTPQVFCFSEELVFCSLKSLLWYAESKKSWERCCFSLRKNSAEPDEPLLST